VASGAPLIGRTCLSAGVEEAVHELSSDMRREAFGGSMVSGSSSFHDKTIGTSQGSWWSPHSPQSGAWRSGARLRDRRQRQLGDGQTKLTSGADWSRSGSRSNADWSRGGRSPRIIQRVWPRGFQGWWGRVIRDHHAMSVGGAAGSRQPLRGEARMWTLRFSKGRKTVSTAQALSPPLGPRSLQVSRDRG
jgi:hypothetical protein